MAEFDILAIIEQDAQQAVPPKDTKEAVPPPPTPGTDHVRPPQGGNVKKVTTKRFCQCSLCDEEREVSELSKGLCKNEGCVTDVACIEKGIASDKDTKKKYYQLKNAKDKTPWQMFCKRWQLIVGPSLGRGVPRGKNYDYYAELEQYETGLSQSDGRQGRWMTFIKACNHWKEELGWAKEQSQKKWSQMLQTQTVLSHPTDETQQTMFVHAFDYANEENYKKRSQIAQAGSKTRKSVAREDAADLVREMMSSGEGQSFDDKKFGRVFNKNDGTGGQDLGMAVANDDVDLTELLDSVIGNMPMPVPKTRAKKDGDGKISDGAVAPAAPLGSDQFDIQTRFSAAKSIHSDIGKCRAALSQLWANGSFLISTMNSRESDSCKLLLLRLKTIEAMIPWPILTDAASALVNKTKEGGAEQVASEWMQDVSNVVVPESKERFSLKTVASEAESVIKDGVPFDKIMTFADFEREVDSKFGSVKSQQEVEKTKQVFTAKFVPLENLKQWMKNNIKDVTAEKKSQNKQPDDAKKLARASLAVNGLRPEANGIASESVARGIFNVSLVRGRAFPVTEGAASIQNSGHPWCVSDMEACKAMSQMSAVKVKVVVGATAATKTAKANTVQHFASEDLTNENLSQITSMLMKHGPEENLRVVHSEAEALPHIFALGAQYEDSFTEPGQIGAARMTLSGTFRHICVPFGQVYQFMQQSAGTEKIKPSEVVKFFAAVTQDFCQIIHEMNNNVLFLVFLTL